MAVDTLQGKIRKLKNPIVLTLSSGPELPQEAQAEGISEAATLGNFCLALMKALKGRIPALRFSFADFALLGPEGLAELEKLLHASAELGYYTLLDTPGLASEEAARRAAQAMLGDAARFPCDGVILPCYLGSDILRPFLPCCTEGKKDAFVLVRSANRSASELQDLRVGSRVTHAVAADYVNRYGEDTLGKYGYTRVGIAAAASSAGSLRSLRTTYPRMFLLVEGMDYPNGNAKNCAAAFDRMGYGAAVCVGRGITAAWSQEAGETLEEKAQSAAERIRRNITRYVTIL